MLPSSVTNKDIIDALNTEGVGPWAMRLTPDQLQQLLRVGATLAFKDFKQAQVIKVVSNGVQSYYFEAVPLGRETPNLRDMVYFK
jgi:hypothetical protein